MVIPQKEAYVDVDVGSDGAIQIGLSHIKEHCVVNEQKGTHTHVLLDPRCTMH